MKKRLWPRLGGCIGTSMSISRAGTAAALRIAAICAAAGSVSAQNGRGVQVYDAIGTTDPAGGTFEIRIIDLATGTHKPYMTVPFPDEIGRAHV